MAPFTSPIRRGIPQHERTITLYFELDIVPRTVRRGTTIAGRALYLVLLSESHTIDQRGSGYRMLASGLSLGTRVMKHGTEILVMV